VALAPASRAARHSMMWKWYSRSRYRIAPFSPFGAASYAATIRSLYSAGNVRRLGLGDQRQTLSVQALDFVDVLLGEANPAGCTPLRSRTLLTVRSSIPKRSASWAALFQTAGLAPTVCFLVRRPVDDLHRQAVGDFGTRTGTPVCRPRGDVVYPTTHRLDHGPGQARWISITWPPAKRGTKGNQSGGQAWQAFTVPVTWPGRCSRLFARGS